MTSNPSDFDATLADLLRDAESQGFALEWAIADDLARNSRDAMAGRFQVGRVGMSRGHLRLAGAGVTQHSVRIGDLGGLLSSFQRTVSAVGASLDGFKSARGALPGSLLGRTTLRLDAAPSPGSVLLTIVPEQSAAEELYPSGDVPLDDRARPLADRSLTEVIRMVVTGTEGDPSADEFRSEFVELGPRAASAVRAFFKIVADDDLDLDLSWQEPRRPTVSAHLSAVQARYLESLIANNRLDEDETELTGIVHTVSDRRPVELEVDGSILRVQLGEEVPDEIRALKVSDQVTLRVSITIEQGAGGNEVVTYTLISIVRATER